MSRIEEAQAEERTEQFIEQAYTYLREKTYPDGCSETRKRVIRKRQRYSAGLLNDIIVDAAQKLLKQAFPALSGLQSVHVLWLDNKL